MAGLLAFIGYAIYTKMEFTVYAIGGIIIASLVSGTIIGSELFDESGEWERKMKVHRARIDELEAIHAQAKAMSAEELVANRARLFGAVQEVINKAEPPKQEEKKPEAKAEKKEKVVNIPPPPG